MPLVDPSHALISEVATRVDRAVGSGGAWGEPVHQLPDSGSIGAPMPKSDL